MTMNVSAGDAAVTIDEVRGWMRLGADRDDAIVAALIRAASNLCEAFIGQLLIERAVSETMPVVAGWLVLSKRPVRTIGGVTGLAADGTEIVLADEAVERDVARDGTVRLRISAPSDAVRVRVDYRAGLAADANGVPEALRQGIIRLVSHLHGARDGARDGADGEPPAIITALWQPWRQITLGRGIGR